MTTRAIVNERITRANAPGNIGVPFLETLRRGWRPMVYWGLGMGLLTFSQVALLPDVEGLQQMSELLETMPPALINAMGGSDAAFNATPEGYIALQIFSFALLILSVYGMVSGLSVSANDEDRGVMDMVLAAPIPRWRLVLEKTLAYVLLSVGIILFTYGGIALALALGNNVDVDVARLAAGTFTLIPGVLFVLAFTVMIAAFIRRRGTVIALVSAFVLLSYFVDAFGRAAPGTFFDQSSRFSYFRLYDGVNVVRDGINVGNIAILLAAAVIFGMLGMIAYQRRDIGR